MIKVYWNGKTELDLTKIKPIEIDFDRIFINKPKGGLWTAENHDWICWCSGEEPHWIREFYYELEIDESQCWRIWTETDIDNSPQIREPRGPCSLNKQMIDYLTIAQNYKGVWVKGRDLHSNWHPISFNAWDVDTVLIFDPSIILSVTRIPIPNYEIAH